MFTYGKHFCLFLSNNYTNEVPKTNTKTAFNRVYSVLTNSEQKDFRAWVRSSLGRKNRMTLHNWLNGIGGPTVTEKAAIAGYFKRSLSEIFPL